MATLPCFTQQPVAARGRSGQVKETQAPAATSACVHHATAPILFLHTWSRLERGNMHSAPAGLGPDKGPQ